MGVNREEVSGIQLSNHPFNAYNMLQYNRNILPLDVIVSCFCFCFLALTLAMVKADLSSVEWVPWFSSDMISHDVLL